MTSEFDTPQGLIAAIRGEVHKDNPNKPAIEEALNLLSEYIGAIHSFAHDVSNGILKLHANPRIGRITIPKTDHFLSLYPRFAEALQNIERLRRKR